jgi:GTP pyrophosphokinase
MPPTTTPPIEERSVAELFPDLEKRFDADQVHLIENALRTAIEAHRGQRRRSGEPYVSHVIAVAQILYGLQMDATSICAGLLHDVLEDTPITHQKLAADFGERVAELVQGVTKISSLSGRSQQRQQVETLRKMILAMSRDIRVVIIKFADRLHNMRTLKWLDPVQRTRIARDTLEVVAPLAARLGMGEVKYELEDIAMRWLMPEAYEYIAGKVAQKREKRESTLEQHTRFLSHLLEDALITIHEISGRPKHFHSIWQKMQSQGLSFEEVYDLNAMRIITETVSDCYDIVGIIHGEWKPLPGRFKDYIAVPKDNLYKSLHTNVIATGGEVIEIQIRTREMHQVAERGVAAHWKYKEGHEKEHELDDKLVWLRQLVEWVKDVQDPGEFLDALQGDVFADTVFCFTPVVELPKNSTVIDFAYRIHSRVGETCAGARVNRKMVPLRTELRSGDLVEILTSRTAHPTADWLEFAKTNRARNKIRHWLRVENLEANVATGREVLNRALRARNVQISVDEIEKRIAKHLSTFRLKSVDEVLAEIGFGALQAPTVLNRVLEAEPRPAQPPKPSPRRATSDASGEGVLVAGLGRTVVHFSRCCNPLPGDDIRGFVTRGRGVSIHRAACQSFLRMMQIPQNADRAIEVSWDEASRIPREIEIRLVARDRAGLLADVTNLVAERGIYIKSSSSRANRDATATLRFKLLIRSNNQLSAVMEHLRRIKGVIELSRVSGPVP